MSKEMFRNVGIGVASATLTLGITASGSAAVISEIRADQTGSDNSEYVEIAGAASESLNDLTYIVIGDGTGGSGVIENVTSLAGLSIGSSGFFLIAESTFENAAGEAFEGITPDLVTSINLENSDNTTHLLVSGFTGANGDDLDTDDDGTLDSTPWLSLIDAIGLIEEVNPPSSTEYAYGASLGFEDLGPDGSFVPGHAYRNGDTGVWTVGLFDLGLPPTSDDTPGFANVVPEPASLALIGLGSIAMLGRRRKA